MSWYLLIPFAFLIFAFLIRIPIGWGMLAGCVAYFLAKGIDLGVVMSTAGYGIYSSYILIAIPLFIFMANIMNTSEVSDKMFNFANALVGRFHGGMGYVNILCSLIFAGMTGSALADASGVGKLEIQHMKKEGYDAPFSAALTATTSVIGPTFPPSIPMVVFAMISGASVGKLFLGGVIPALLQCIMLAIYVYLISKKRNYPRGDKINFKKFCVDTVKALPALFTPVLLLTGIYTGVMTPTEAGAVAAAYTLLISVFVYRTLTWKGFKKVLLDTLKTTGSIFVIVAAAYSFSYIISLEQVAQWMSGLIMGFSGSKYMFLLLVNIIFLILGCFVDVNVTQLVFVPIFIPVAKALGIDMVHLGVVLCLNMMIGLCTPPFGMLLFISANAGETSLKGVIKEALPMVGFMLVGLMLITFWPDIVMWLPNMMG